MQVQFIHTPFKLYFGLQQLLTAQQIKNDVPTVDDKQVPNYTYKTHKH